jgi:hypothetical protein
LCSAPRIRAGSRIRAVSDDAQLEIVDPGTTAWGAGGGRSALDLDRT